MATNSKKIDKLIAQAINYHELGQLDKAQTIYFEVLKLQPQNFSAIQLVGVIFSQIKNYNLAIEYLTKAIRINPYFAPCYNNIGLVFFELNRFNDAIENFDKAIKLESNYLDAHFNKGNSLLELKKFDDAIICFNQVIEINPNFAEACCNKGIAFQSLKQFDAAIISYDKAILINPNFAEAHFNKGNALKALKHFDAAIISYDKAIILNPNFADAHHNKGNTLRALKRLDAAIVCYDQVIILKPDFAEAYCDKANVFLDLKEFDAAIAGYDKAIILKPDFAEAYFNKGNAFLELKQFDEAIASYDQAIIIKPDYAEAYCNKGNVLQILKKFDAAIAGYNKAIIIKPDFATAHSNLGSALLDIRKFDDAIVSFDLAISIESDFAEAFCNKGIAFLELGEFNAAIASFDQAINIKNDFSEAHYNRGVALEALKKFELAIESYVESLRLNPEVDWAIGNLLYSQMRLGDWSSIKIYFDKISKEVLAGRKTIVPLALMAMTDDPSLLKKAAEIYVKYKCPSDVNPYLFQPSISKKIRIAYISPDFKTCPVGLLTAELFETHNRDRFEVFAFSLKPLFSNDKLCTRLKKGFDKFIDVSLNSDLEVSQLSRDFGIDIAIDLAGHTDSSRPGIFYNRAAPIQVNWLGYPGTSGASFIDYVISDEVVTPLVNQSFYSEKIAYLPNSLMVDDSTRTPSSRVFSKEECGLPKNAFIFCCFNTHYKFNEELLDSWSKILSMASNSVLWIPDHGQLFSLNIQNQFFIRGIDSSRIIFAKRMDDISDHLARIKLADLFLDTHPYNAHTSTLDSLKGGVPVLTLMGKSHASRIAASILKCMDLEELITTSRDEYENLAIHLAAHPEKIIALKNKLTININKSPLFDTTLFTKNIESLYEKMYERYQSNLEPDHINEPA
jgi:predicted O-linked N-acetylglucosamine transferase (SPINDLY family)